MRTIAVINQKGGVGKTTTVASLAAAIAADRKDICVIDLDPQAHLTLSVGVEPGVPKLSIYDVLTSQAPLADAVIDVAPHLMLVPSTIDLAAAEVELVGEVGREQILRDQIAELKRPLEFIMIDCPPSLGLLTLNALAAADEVVIPLQPHFLALQGLGKLLQTTAMVQKRINPRLRVSGVVLCMYESSARLTAEVVADLRGFFEAARGTNVPWADARIFDTVIRRNVKLAECPSYGKTIFDYEPKSNGALDYKALAREFCRQYKQPKAPAAPSDMGVPPMSGTAVSAVSSADVPPVETPASQESGQDARPTLGPEAQATTPAADIIQAVNAPPTTAEAIDIEASTVPAAPTQIEPEAPDRAMP